MSLRSKLQSDIVIDVGSTDISVPLSLGIFSHQIYIRRSFHPSKNVYDLAAVV